MKRLHDHCLQAVFPAALGWGLALTFARAVDRLGAWTPVGEGHRWHGWLETNLPLAIVVLACGAVMLAVYRRWPRYLRVPDATSWRRLVLGAILCAAITVPLLMISGGLAGAILETKPADPGNPQYIPLWIFTATFIPYAWTPAAAVLLAWWLFRRHAGA